MDRLGPKWTYGLNRNKQGHSGPNRTNVDQTKPMWIEEDKMDLIRFLNIYHFYCIFRAHISNL